MDLFVRLRARRAEIEEAIFARVRAISAPVSNEDANYEVGLRAAVAAVVGYGFAGIEAGQERSEPVPLAVIEQARRAARCGVSLDTVLIRYIAGHRVFGDFVMSEADSNGLSSDGPTLCHLRRMQESLLERLTAAVASEYKHELERISHSPDQRRRELVGRLLDNEPVELAGLDYEFDHWHVGIIATGVGAAKTVRGLADGLGRQLLSVSCDEGIVWAWLGGQRRFAMADLERLLLAQGPSEVSLAVGEAGRGMEGFRLTHQQAQGALLVALHRPQRLTRYAEDMLLAAALQDATLARSLENIYLSPLCSEKDGGAALCGTLRAYFNSDHNVRAAALKVKADRGTVRKRLSVIEERLGCLLHTRQAELEVALCLKDLRQDSPASYVPLPELRVA